MNECKATRKNIWSNYRGKRRWVVRGARRGSVALAALVCLLVGLVFAIALLNLAGGGLQVGSRSQKQAQLRSLTEGGLEYGYWMYAWDSQTLPYTATNCALGPGTFSVTVTNNSLAISSTVKVVSTGTIGSNSMQETRIYPMPSPPNYSNFFGANTLTINGTGTFNSGRLEATYDHTDLVTTIWHNTAVSVSAFTTQFTYQEVDGTSGMPGGADGMTFCIQTGGPWQVGPDGGGLGYGPDSTSGSPGIPNSVAIKLDLWNNQGEGNNSTGLYTNGAAPTIPAVDLTTTTDGNKSDFNYSTSKTSDGWTQQEWDNEFADGNGNSSKGINLHSGDIIQVNITYDGTTLTVTILDTVTNISLTQSYLVNIPGIVGSNTAYVGFTASTGGATSTQDILSWTYTNS